MIAHALHNLTLLGLHAERWVYREDCAMQHDQLSEQDRADRRSSVSSQVLGEVDRRGGAAIAR